MTKPVYLLLLFYPTLKENEALVRAARDEIANICGNNFTMLGFGEHSCAIAFPTDENPELLGNRFRRIRGEKLHSVLVRVESVVEGATYRQACTWLVRNLPSGLPRS